MPVNREEFFRGATLRICGSLSIEKALFDLFSYLRQFIPVDRIFLSYQRPEELVLELVATAAEDGGRLENRVFPGVPTQILKTIRSGDFVPVTLVNRPADHPWAEYLSGVFGWDCSVIWLRLMVEGRRIGGVVVVANRPEAYTQEHADLLAVLNEPFAIALSNFLRYRELKELKDRLDDENRYLQQELRSLTETEVVGAEAGLKLVMEKVRWVAPLSTPVLVLGETGVGKEVIAKAIHNLSPRAKGPFVKVNCGSIPPTLMDSELFGHEKGAFTGASSRKYGWFERASGGTVFLDEVGELTQEAQVRLLRVLQDKEIERVGGAKPIKVDIRVIAATHRHLESLLRVGRFREDLYFRLNVFPIEIPPLRERIMDIPLLANHFALKKAYDLGLGKVPSFAPGELKRLQQYVWPGNVRELENAVERSIIVSHGEPLTFAHVPASVTDNKQDSSSRVRQMASLDEITAEYISRVLVMVGGRIEGKRGAASILGVKPNTLRHRMRRLNIPFGRKARGRDSSEKVVE